MKTWIEMEAEIEPELRKAAQALDQMEAEEAAMKAEFDAKIKAATLDVKAKLQAEQARMHADLETRRTRLHHDLDEMDRKLGAEVDRLDANLVKAESTIKADLEVQRARMTTIREKVNAQLKAIYEAQIKHMKSQIAEMQDWAQTTGEKVRAKINADLETLHQKAVDIEQHIQKLHAEGVARWNENKARIERAIADLRVGYDKAKADLKEGREKARAEFEKTV